MIICKFVYSNVLLSRFYDVITVKVAEKSCGSDACIATSAELAWSHKGTWTKVLAAVSDAPDLDYLMVNGCIVHVHQHGTAKKHQHEEAMGLSRDGLSTQIHAAVDALGKPVRLLPTTGQTSEYTQAEALIAGFTVGNVLADKGYDSDPFVAAIRANQGIPVIPSQKNWLWPLARRNLCIKIVMGG